MKYIVKKNYANLWHNTVIIVKHEHYFLHKNKKNHKIQIKKKHNNKEIK